MSNTPAATLTYYGLVFVFDYKEIERAKADSGETPADGEWLSYTSEIDGGFVIEAWSLDAGATWRADLSNETLDIGVVAESSSMTAALDALFDKLRPLDFALGRLKANVTNWGQ